MRLFSRPAGQLLPGFMCLPQVLITIHLGISHTVTGFMIQGTTAYSVSSISIAVTGEFVYPTSSISYTVGWSD